MNQLNRCQPFLGTYVEVSLSGDADDDELIAISRRAYAHIENVQSAMSFHDRDSELSRINRNACERPIKISTAMKSVLSEVSRLNRLSLGFFDPTIARHLLDRGKLPVHHVRKKPEVPRGNWQNVELDGEHIFFNKALQIDLGGIAKGYAVDRALESIPAHIKATVNAGGDLRSNDWQQQHISIRVPDLERLQVVQMPMQAPAVASSANYFQTQEQGKIDGVLICPHSGQAHQGKNSVSVFADNCMLADALTKVIFLMPESRPLLKALNATALVVDGQGGQQYLQWPEKPMISTAQ